MNIKDYAMLMLYSISDPALQINIEGVSNFIGATHDDGNMIYIIGNGGSSALAEHFAQDLTKACGIPAIALTHTANLTAYGNDLEFSKVFSEQLKVYFREDDTLVCFTSSGNSPDIIEACKTAKKLKGFVVSFTGFSGGIVKEISDLNLHVPIENYGVVETAHSLIMHNIIEELK